MMIEKKYSYRRRMGEITEVPVPAQGSGPRDNGEVTGVNVERTDRIAGHREVIVCVAAVLSVVAALTNLWAAPQQYVELWGYDAFRWWGYAAIYLLLYLAQGLYGVALLRWPTQRVFLAGLASASGAILLYITTRTVGVPFGPTAGRVEGVGLLDSLGLLAEVGLAVSLIAVLHKPRRDKALTVLGCLVAAAWALRLLGVLS